MGSLGVVKMIFWGCSLRRGRRGELYPGQALWASVFSSVKMGITIVPASWEDVRIKEEAIYGSFKTIYGCRGPKAHGRERRHIVLWPGHGGGWEPWFSRVEPAWILKQPVTLNGCTWFGNICPWPSDGWGAGKTWPPLRSQHWLRDRRPQTRFAN